MADEKTRCPKCLAWYNALEGRHNCRGDDRIDYVYRSIDGK